MTAFAIIACACLSGCWTSYPRTVAYSESVAPVGAAVDVTNNKGDVRVIVDPSAEQITATALIRVSTKVAKKERPFLADEVEFSASLEDDGPWPVLRVRAISPDSTAVNHRIDVLVSMPRCTGARVNNANGIVELKGVSGSLQVENKNGPVLVRTPHRMDEPVALVTTAGDIAYLVPPGSTGDIDANSHDGIVSFRSMDVVSGSTAQGSSFHTVLNNGANSVVLRTDKGDVRIFVREDPLSLRVKLN